MQIISIILVPLIMISLISTNNNNIDEFRLKLIPYKSKYKTHYFVSLRKTIFMITDFKCHFKSQKIQQTIQQQIPNNLFQTCKIRPNSPINTISLQQLANQQQMIYYNLNRNAIDIKQNIVIETKESAKINTTSKVQIKIANQSDHTSNNTIIVDKYQLKLNPSINSRLTLPKQMVQQLNRKMKCDFSKVDVVCRLAGQKGYSAKDNSQWQHADNKGRLLIDIDQPDNQNIQLSFFDQGCKLRYDHELYSFYYMCVGNIGVNDKGVIEVGNLLIKDIAVIKDGDFVYLNRQQNEIWKQSQLDKITIGEIRNITTQVQQIFKQIKASSHHSVHKKPSHPNQEEDGNESGSNSTQQYDKQYVPINQKILQPYSEKNQSVIVPNMMAVLSKSIANIGYLKYYQDMVRRDQNKQQLLINKQNKKIKYLMEQLRQVTNRVGSADDIQSLKNQFDRLFNQYQRVQDTEQKITVDQQKIKATQNQIQQQISVKCNVYYCL